MDTERMDYLLNILGSLRAQRYIINERLAWLDKLQNFPEIKKQHKRLVKVDREINKLSDEVLRGMIFG